MISLKKRNLDGKGFTIVELLIVIVVIGILALLVITTYSGIQAKARNSKRQTDIQAIQTQLEAFFSENGYYPSNHDMNEGTDATTNADSTYVASHMKSLDQEALTDPSNSAGTRNLLATPDATKHQYAYAVTDSSDSADACDTTDTTCAKYTLTAQYEGTVNGKTSYQKSNLD
jgi:prepilin-type N-terminal cleavage/methylation domain-containing protein